MTQSSEFALRIAGFAAIPFCALLMFSGSASGQLGSSGGTAPAPLAAPLPLSGRIEQNGSVTATQSPIPGTTTNVNTLNPTVQAQGAYAESVNGMTSLPFSGKLSLREGVQRGIRHNPGAADTAQAVREPASAH